MPFEIQNSAHLVLERLGLNKSQSLFPEAFEKFARLRYQTPEQLSCRCQLVTRQCFRLAP